MLAGRNVFDVHNFVYPPTAAVMSVPIAGVDTRQLDRAALLVTIVAVLAVSALSVHLFAPPAWWRPPAAALFAGVVMAGNTSYHALPLDNVSVLLAPFALAVIWLFGRGRWWTGCIVLEVSILLKPLLAAVVLVPLLARRWLPLLVTGAVSATLLVASLQLGGGLSRAHQVLQHLLNGSILVGSRAVGNLTLTGFASVHHLQASAVRAARVVVAAAAGGACLAALRFRRWDVAEVAWVVTVLVTAVYLAGSLSRGPLSLHARPRGGRRRPPGTVTHRPWPGRARPPGVLCAAVVGGRRRRASRQRDRRDLAVRSCRSRGGRRLGAGRADRAGRHEGRAGG